MRQAFPDVPLVAVGSGAPSASDAIVTYDDPAVGRLAARKLLRHPLAAAGCVHAPWHVGSAQRRRGFEQVMRESATPFAALADARFEGEKLTDFAGRAGTTGQIAAWIQSLAKPCGILATNDPIGLAVLNACVSVGIAVPGDVLVVGVDNCETLCLMPRPTLTSIGMPFSDVGKAAARVLEDLMEGKPPPAAPMALPPSGIHERESTLWVPTDDPLVADAMALIGDGWLDRRTVADLARELACNRRTLERRFRLRTGLSVHEMRQQHRLRKATELLRRGVMSVRGVAEACGFRSPQSLEALIKRETGQLPREILSSAVRQREGQLAPYRMDS
jgi:LacI family transcriptional regulator